MIQSSGHGVPSPWYLQLWVFFGTLNFDLTHHFRQTQRVFECWSTGKLMDMTTLTKDMAQDLTRSHRNGLVMKLKAAKFDEIISEAYELISPPRAHSEGNNVVIAFDPSSPVKGSDELCAPSSPVRGSDEWYVQQNTPSMNVLILVACVDQSHSYVPMTRQGA